MSNLALFGRPILAGDMIPKVFSGLIAHTIAKLLGAQGITADQPQSNGMWAIHQFRAVLPGDTTAYRVIIAPAHAPIFIGEVSADEHFSKPLMQAAAE